MSRFAITLVIALLSGCILLQASNDEPKESAFKLDETKKTILLDARVAPALR
jgi:hypothetical protein